MLDNLKFAQYVNEERKKLIKSTRERGVYVADNAQLSEVVARNSEIQPYEATSTDKVSVTFLDADGTLLKREYLDIGGTATAPSNPTLDSDYLTFSGWSDTVLTNITESKTIYATYTTKDNATYIFIHIPTANKAITLSFGGTITSVDWGDGTTDATKSHTYSTIGDYVIKVIGGTSITSYILGSNNYYFVLKCYVASTITSLGNYVFNYCYSLKSITLPSTITSLGIHVFADCHSLTRISLPNTITTLNSNIFYQCSSLQEITLPSGITSLSSSIFSTCSCLTKITLPSSINYINSEAFYNCYSLKSITLPSGITSLGSRVFQDCRSLTNISLPSGITRLSSGTFLNCYSLQQVVINADSVIIIYSDTFLRDAYGTKFYVPDNLVEDYKVATNWVNFADRIYPLSSLGE